MDKLALKDAAPRLFDEVLDRAQTEMPDWYLPSAEGVLIAGEDILGAAGHRPGSPDPAGWSHGASGFRKLARDGKTVLWVQRCGQFWIIERSLRLGRGDTRGETLVFAFGARPIWTRTRAAAMRLAEFCDPIPPAPVAGYWADDGQCSRR